MKTINMPQDLINEAPSPASSMPEILKDLPVEKKKLTLHELLELKNSISEELVAYSKKVGEIKHITVEEINKHLLHLEALNYNLANVKTLLSIGNGPIYLDMYTKSGYESIRVTMNRIATKNRAKTKKAQRDKAISIRDGIQEKCNILDARLRNYNSKVPVEVELIKLS